MATALITGASSGIGAALAVEHARLGWSVLLVARSEAGLQTTASACREANPRVQVALFVADVSRPEFTAQLHELLRDVNDLQMIHVNAGVGAVGRFEKIKIEIFKRAFDTNVIGAVQTIQGCMPALRRAHGRIVLIASMNSYLALPLGSAYSMTKYAVRALGEALDAELAGTEVSISTVYPGPVKTNMMYLNNRGERNPEAVDFFAKAKAMPAAEAARRIIRGALRGKRHFCLTWTEAAILGLQRHFPRTVAALLRFGYRRFEPKIASIIGKIDSESI